MRIGSDRLASYAAFLIAGLVVAVTIRQGGFVAHNTDASGYVSAGELWRRSDLFRAEPLHFWASWHNASDSASPLAYRAGVIRGTEVPVYPMGFPVLCAAASTLAGSLGPYLVAPMLSGVLVWCAFALARLLAGPLAGLLAAVMLGSSPVVLYHAVHPMSDVPAAAMWCLAWLMAVRGTISASAAAGVATSMAILVRPNLAPLATVCAAVILLGHHPYVGPGRARAIDDQPAQRGRWRWRALAMFALAAAPGPLLIMWSQAVLYGGPFASGYGDWGALFNWAHVPVNLRVYPRLLIQTHTWLPLLGLTLAGAGCLRLRALPTRESRVVAISAGLVALVNVALYLPYLPYDQWPFLRFVLPALTALFVLLGGLIALVTASIWTRAKWAAVAAPMMTALVIAQSVPFTRYAMADWRAQTRVRLMGRYLSEALPPHAIVLSFIHSGSIAHYTGREVIRLDVLDPTELDRIVDDLTAHHYRPVFVLDRLLEDDRFRAVFASSRFGRLDWAPRAEFATVTSIRYFDAADLAPFRTGARWPIDVLR